MKGNNTLTVNVATMIEAMQLLADRDMPGMGKVTGFKVTPQGSGMKSYGDTFDVTFEKPDPTP